MSINEFDVTREIQEAFKSIPPKFKALYAALIDKDGLPTNHLLDKITGLSRQSQKEETARLESTFIAKQKTLDSAEAQQDSQEARQDGDIEVASLGAKHTLHQQLVGLERQLEEQRQHYTELVQSIKKSASQLESYSAHKEANESPLKDTHPEAYAAQRQIALKARKSAERLESLVKKMPSEMGLLTQIEQVKTAITGLEETTFKELKQRLELRTARECLRSARAHAEKSGHSLDQMLSPEVRSELIKEIAQNDAKINQRKARLKEEVQAQIHPLFLEFLNDQFTTCMNLSKTDLKAVYEIARHIQTLENDIGKIEHSLLEMRTQDGQLKNPQTEINQLLTKNTQLQKNIQVTRLFKKAAILSASASTLGTLGSMAVVLLVLSTPPVALTASFLLLTAIATTALVIRLQLHQNQKQKTQQVNHVEIEQLTGDGDKKQSLGNAIQNTEQELHTAHKELEQRRLSAGEIYKRYGAAENPAIDIPKLSISEEPVPTPMLDSPISLSSRTLPGAGYRQSVSLFPSHPLENEEDELYAFATPRRR